MPRHQARARVQLIIDVEITSGGNYGEGWKIEDIYRDAEKMAIAHIERAAAKDRHITIIGPPHVVAVTVTKHQS